MTTASVEYCIDSGVWAMAKTVSDLSLLVKLKVADSRVMLAVDDDGEEAVELSRENRALPKAATVPLMAPVTFPPLMVYDETVPSEVAVESTLMNEVYRRPFGRAGTRT